MYKGYTIKIHKCGECPFVDWDNPRGMYFCKITKEWLGEQYPLKVSELCHIKNKFHGKVTMYIEEEQCQ